MPAVGITADRLARQGCCCFGVTHGQPGVGAVEINEVRSRRLATGVRRRNIDANLHVLRKHSIDLGSDVYLVVARVNHYAVVAGIAAGYVVFGFFLATGYGELGIRYVRHVTQCLALPVGMVVYRQPRFL